MSLDLVRSVFSTAGPVIDVGGGASALVGGVLDPGFACVAVLDVARQAFKRAEDRLGARADLVRRKEVRACMTRAVVR